MAYGLDRQIISDRELKRAAELNAKIAELQAAKDRFFRDCRRQSAEVLDVIGLQRVIDWMAADAARVDALLSDSRVTTNQLAGAYNRRRAEYERQQQHYDD